VALIEWLAMEEDIESMPDEMVLVLFDFMYR
jgi:hypothetical protein